MSAARVIGLTLLGTAWVVACLVLPPMVASWLMPPGPVAVARGSDLPIRFVPSASSEASGRSPFRWTAPDPDVPRRLDVYGNEIARPVAKYRVDDRGTLYEVHSPQTEVPRLPPPRL